MILALLTMPKAMLGLGLFCLLALLVLSFLRSADQVGRETDEESNDE